MSKVCCEVCKGNIKSMDTICPSCVRDFYWLHSLWMAGLNQTKEQDK